VLGATGRSQLLQRVQIKGGERSALKRVDLGLSFAGALIKAKQAVYGQEATAPRADVVGRKGGGRAKKMSLSHKEGEALNKWPKANRSAPIREKRRERKHGRKGSSSAR